MRGGFWFVAVLCCVLPHCVVMACAVSCGCVLGCATVGCHVLCYLMFYVVMLRKLAHVTVCCGFCFAHCFVLCCVIKQRKAESKTKLNQAKHSNATQVGIALMYVCLTV